MQKVYRIKNNCGRTFLFVNCRDCNFSSNEKYKMIFSIITHQRVQSDFDFSIMMTIILGGWKISILCKRMGFYAMV